MEEIWKEIREFKGKYLISNKGNVYSNVTNRYLKGSIDSNGYIQVHLTNDKNAHIKCLIHQLVANEFIPNPYNLPQINHKDGCKLNNKQDNLEWCNQSYNTRHAYDNNLIDKSGVSHKVKCLYKDKWYYFDSLKDCASYFKVAYQDISKRVLNVRANPSIKGKLKGIYFEYND